MFNPKFWSDAYSSTSLLMCVSELSLLFHYFKTGVAITLGSASRLLYASEVNTLFLTNLLTSNRRWNRKAKINEQFKLSSFLSNALSVLGTLCQYKNTMCYTSIALLC